MKGAQSKNREREEMRDAVLDTARELLELMGNSAETRRTLVSSIQDELGLKRPTDGRFIRKSLRDEGLLPHPH
ncbi:hypothetical protein NOR53_2250 [gamma proteobacterium NOR5-3]|nr:hypothetical protein NOR53_2250 [gamma proteobacterium NOR5-3]